MHTPKIMSLSSMSRDPRNIYPSTILIINFERIRFLHKPKKLDSLMTTRRSVFSKLLLAAGCLALTPLPAKAQFCEQYVQTWSNAGQCKDCQISLSKDNQHPKYTVKSNNGWTANLAYRSDRRFQAYGIGQWENGLGHAYSGQRFELLLSHQGEALLMLMVTHIKGARKLIQAKFRCLNKIDNEQYRKS